VTSWGPASDDHDELPPFVGIIVSCHMHLAVHIVAPSTVILCFMLLVVVCSCHMHLVVHIAVPSTVILCFVLLVVVFSRVFWHKPAHF
jgi:hypothetical protein